MIDLDDSSPVDPDEYVYRRVHGSFYDSSLPVPFHRDAFRPTAKDTTGLSVLRALFAKPEDVLVLVSEEKRSQSLVVQFSVRDLQQLGLTVVPDPRPPIAGHALITEINSVDYQKDKATCKELQGELARLASIGIVICPSEPTA